MVGHVVAEARQCRIWDEVGDIETSQLKWPQQRGLLSVGGGALRCCCSCLFPAAPRAKSREVVTRSVTTEWGRMMVVR